MKDLTVTIPVFAWKQVDGDMSPETYGGTIAKADGSSIELLKIQPVREYVGDKEAAEVGFPFWSREAYFDAADLSLDSEEVKSALQCCGLDDSFLADLSPEVRAVAIACALLNYGVADEGPAGWSKDFPNEDVEWWDGRTKPLRELLATEDDEFRREVLGEEEGEDDENDEAEETESADSQG